MMDVKKITKNSKKSTHRITWFTINEIVTSLAKERSDFYSDEEWIAEHNNYGQVRYNRIYI